MEQDLLAAHRGETELLERREQGRLAKIQAEQEEFDRQQRDLQAQLRRDRMAAEEEERQHQFVQDTMHMMRRFEQEYQGPDQRVDVGQGILPLTDAKDVMSQRRAGFCEANDLQAVEDSLARDFHSWN